MPPFSPSTQANILSPTSRGPGGTGELDDAKIYEIAVSLAANETKVLDIDANAFYCDDGPIATGSVQFNIDECTPLMALRYALFFRTRRFTRIRLKNLTALVQPIHLIYSRNPDFLVMQFQV